MHIQYSEFRAHSVFQGKRKFLETSEWWKYTLLNTVKNSRATLFFRAIASSSKILNDKIYFDTKKISRATLFFQGKRKFLKNPE